MSSKGGFYKHADEFYLNLLSVGKKIPPYKPSETKGTQQAVLGWRGWTTWNNEVDRCSRIPAETHRVAQHQLGLHWSESQALASAPAVAVQSVDVVRQAEQLAVRVS